MYRNVFGEKVSRARYREMLTAANNRRELIAAGLTSRRDLFKMGLLSSAGLLLAKGGLSSRAYGQTVNGGTNQLCLPNNQPASPPTTPFVQPLPISPAAVFGFSVGAGDNDRTVRATGMIGSGSTKGVVGGLAG